MKSDLIEVRDKDGLVGYKCPVCNRFFGRYENSQATSCLESHKNLLVEEL